MYYLQNSLDTDQETKKSEEFVDAVGYKLDLAPLFNLISLFVLYTVIYPLTDFSILDFELAKNIIGVCVGCCFFSTFINCIFSSDDYVMNDVNNSFINVIAVCANKADIEEDLGPESRLSDLSQDVEAQSCFRRLFGDESFATL